MRRVLFLIPVIVVLWLLHAVPFIVAANLFGITLAYWQWKLLAVATIMLALNAGPRLHDNIVTSSLYILSSIWLGFIFLFFSAALVFTLLSFVGVGTTEVFTGLNVAAVMLGIYAHLNAWRLGVKEYTIPITGLSKEIRAVHLSDIHIGTVHRERFLRRVVKITNSLQPEVVFMTGDLFDGSAPIHEKMLCPLDNIKVPTYFSTGNHEEYEGLKLVHETIANLKMQLLDSEVATFGELQVIGVNDRQSLPKEESLKTILPTIAYDKIKPTVLMYHTPVEWDEARDAGVDLMLSGHTHKGQIFPFTLLVRLSFKYVEGLFSEQGVFLHVTPGTGTWGPPMRLGSRNQITVLKLVPKE